MVREIVKDPAILTKVSEPFIFGKDDIALIHDMLDTANAHKAYCAGLAAIQIGVNKRVILVQEKGKFVVYINPEIIDKSIAAHLVREGCLSIDGTRTVKRHYTVKVKWTDQSGKEHKQTFKDFTAQVLQHEIDHLNGVLI